MLKLIGRLLLIPVWMILGVAWIIVHIIVEMFGVFHGVWKLVFGTAAVLSLCFDMWQNVIAAILFIAATFLVGVYDETRMGGIRFKVDPDAFCIFRLSMNRI